MFLTLNDVPELLRPFYHLVTREVPRLDDEGNPELVEEVYTYHDEHGEPVEGSRWVPAFDPVETVEPVPRGHTKSEAALWVVVRIHRGQRDDVVQQFLAMWQHGEQWRFHDAYLAWLAQAPVPPVASGEPDDPDTEAAEQWQQGMTPAMYEEALATWQAAEPVPPVVQSWDEWRFAHYAELRRVGYHSDDKQFEMMHDDLKNGTTTWQDSQEAVKAQYPKAS